MRTRALSVLLTAGCAAGLLPLQGAVTASNGVGATRLGRYQTAITANTLKPSQCVSLTLTTLVTGPTGTSGADLLLGTAGPDSLSALGGNDCVLGGGGNDSLNGGSGTDVCIGGPGTDTFTSCETQIQ